MNDPTGAIDYDIPVVAASAGLFDTINGSLSAGRYFDGGHDERA